MALHRYWSHKSFEASPSLRLVFSVFVSMIWHRSIYWWVIRHRMHHRFIDSENDPYNAKRGLWFSHMGWHFEKPRYTKLEYVDMSDLDSDPSMYISNVFFLKNIYTNLFL
jgi:stearoyl-CoA desaturase (Delta-9 desaturase)